MNRQMAAVEAQLEEALIKQHCQQLRLPSVASQCSRLAEQLLNSNRHIFSI